MDRSSARTPRVAGPPGLVAGAAARGSGFSHRRRTGGRSHRGHVTAAYIGTGFRRLPAVAALIAKVLALTMHLPVDRGRTLAFSLGTRNSFVVLPFALALPSGWELAAVVIVVQSMVELFGMVAYLWWLPNHLYASQDMT